MNSANHRSSRARSGCSRASFCAGGCGSDSGSAENGQSGSTAISSGAGRGPSAVRMVNTSLAPPCGALTISAPPSGPSQGARSSVSATISAAGSPGAASAAIWTSGMTRPRRQPGAMSSGPTFRKCSPASTITVCVAARNSAEAAASTSEAGKIGNCAGAGPGSPFRPGAGCFAPVNGRMTAPLGRVIAGSPAGGTAGRALACDLAIAPHMCCRSRQCSTLA